jgi:hypothetical protein
MLLKYRALIVIQFSKYIDETCTTVVLRKIGVYRVKNEIIRLEFLHN